MAFEKDTDVWIPFRVVDADGDGVTGQNAAALSGMKFKQLTQSGTTSTAFTEVDTAAADYEVNDLGEGDYEVMIPGSGGATANNDTAALCWVNGAASGGKFVPVFVEVIDPAYPDLLKLFLDIIDQSTGQLDSGSFAASGLTAIGGAVWDEDATGHQTGGTFGQAIGDPAANTETMYDAVVTDAAGTNVAADIIALDSVADAILVDTGEIGAAGAGLTEAGGDGDHLTEAGGDGDHLTEAGGTGDQFTGIPWNNAAWDAEVESEVNDALVALHLDHLLAADYDPASKPGTSTALLNELVESDGGVSRFTANAVEEVWGGTLSEPSGVPAWTDTYKEAINWLLALTRNRVTQTSTTQTLRDDADASDIATAAVSDDGTTFVRGEWT